MVPLQRNGLYWYGGKWVTPKDYMEAVATPRYTEPYVLDVIESRTINQTLKDLRGVMRQMDFEPPASRVQIELFSRGAPKIKKAKGASKVRVLSWTWFGRVSGNVIPRGKRPGLLTIQEDGYRFRIEVVYDGRIDAVISAGTTPLIKVQLHRVESTGDNAFLLYGTVDQKDLLRIKRLRKR